jgi:hypothetical protein
MMTRAVHELQGYTMVLDKIVFVTRVFRADGDEGWQFNVRFSSDALLSPRFPTRNDADLARGMLIQAIRES